MSHSLNEISRVIPSGTAATNIELILDTLEELMDGVRDGYYVYFDTEKTMGYHFRYEAGYDTCRVDIVAGATITGYVSSFNLTSSLTLYAHKSTDETVTYIGFSGNVYLSTFYVLGHNGSKNIYNYEGSDDIKGTGENMVNPKSFSPFRTSKNAGVIAITKMPDLLNLNSYDEFYVVVGSSGFTPTNYLVKFGDTVYRFASFQRDPSDQYYPCFAFPVSDPITP